LIGSCILYLERQKKKRKRPETGTEEQIKNQRNEEERDKKG
jgi:hypothetical protein